MDAETYSETLVPAYETKRRLTLLVFEYVSSWYLGRETGYPEISRGFVQFLQTNILRILPLDDSLSLPKPSQFIIHRDSNLLTAP